MEDFFGIIFKIAFVMLFFVLPALDLFSDMRFRWLGDLTLFGIVLIGLLISALPLYFLFAFLFCLYLEAPWLILIVLGINILSWIIFHGWSWIAFFSSIIAVPLFYGWLRCGGDSPEGHGHYRSKHWFNQ